MHPLKLAIVLAIIGATAARADYELRDGDVVAFLGDSITAARTYGKIVENYTLLRYPQRKVRFVNAGVGGDTATLALARLERDVLDRGATAVIVALGVNDIGWGMKADAAHKQAYLDGVRDIIERCRAKKVRVYLCSAAVTSADPDKSENDFLQKMCDEGMTLATSMGEHAIDVQRTMREIQRRVAAANAARKDEKSRVSLHVADGVHLSELGQLAMAYAIIKGLGGPPEVSSVGIDVSGAARVTEAAGCTVSEVTGDGKTLEFTRLDEGHPINFGPFAAFNFLYVPIPDQLNRYMLKVTGLAAGKYEVTVDGRKLGVFTSQQLGAERGANISSSTADAWHPGGPWDVEASVLKRLTESRDELDVARSQTRLYLETDPRRADLDERVARINEAVEQLQRAVVKPTPYRFVVRRVE